MRWFALLCLFAFGCEASFTDLRPKTSDTPDVDAGFVDVGAPPADDEVRLRGTFEGRGSYAGGGEAAIVLLATGEIELRFADDFTTSSVPGPVVVLTTRDRIGNRIDTGAGDIEVGPLDSASGAKTFTVSGAALSSSYVWVFCKPFGVEISRAELTEVSP